MISPFATIFPRMRRTPLSVAQENKILARNHKTALRIFYMRFSSWLPEEQTVPVMPLMSRRSHFSST